MGKIASLFVIMSIVSTSFTAHAVGETCPQIVKSQVLINRSENSALVLKTTRDQKVIYEYCKIKNSTNTMVAVEDCSSVGSKEGYSVGELISLDKTLNKGKWRHRITKTGVYLGSALLGLYAGTFGGFYLSSGGGHGLEAVVYGIYGAVIGVAAGPACGGLIYNLVTQNSPLYAKQQRALQASNKALSESGVVVTKESVKQISRDLSDALENLRK